MLKKEINQVKFKKLYRKSAIDAFFVRLDCCSKLTQFFSYCIDIF